MFDVEIAVGEYNLKVGSANIDDSGYFNTCACSGDGEGTGRRVEGVWSPTALVLSVAKGDSGGCTDCKQTSQAPAEITDGNLYVFDTYSGEEIDGKHSVFEGASGAMTFLLNGAEGDTVEFIAPPETARVTFTKTVEAKAVEGATAAENVPGVTVTETGVQTEEAVAAKAEEVEEPREAGEKQQVEAEAVVKPQEQATEVQPQQNAGERPEAAEAQNTQEVTQERKEETSQQQPEEHTGDVQLRNDNGDEGKVVNSRSDSDTAEKADVEEAEEERREEEEEEEDDLE
ncbi:MAG: hypothetical protein ACTJLL_02990 [Anaplasma sp.]